MPELFSFYKNGIADKVPYKQYTVERAIELIRVGFAAEDVARLRAATEPSTQKVLKNALSYFTFSGIFKRCEESGLIEHSGIICIDFDNLTDMAEAKHALTSFSFVLACFVSPRGNGYKVLVRIDPALHTETFVSLEWLFKANGYEVDTSGIDVSRACFISHDPDAYFNPDAETYYVDAAELPGIREHLNPVDLKPKLSPVEQTKALKVIDFVVDQIEEQGIDLTADYRDWMYIFFSLSTLGEDGRDYLHRVSQFNSSYSRKETDYKFNNAVRTGRFTTPAKFFDLAKKAGVEIKLPKAVVQLPVAGRQLPEKQPKPMEYDTLFEDAAKLVVIHQQGSTSLIQRSLKLGYNRAGRIIDQLENAGIIGPFEGDKARAVLVADEYELENILVNLTGTIAPEPETTPKSKGDYQLINERHGEPIHLVTNEALIWELTQKDYPNIMHHINRFNDASASKLRAISNNVRLVSRQPDQDFDLCDMLVAKRFTLAINLIADEYINYQNYLLNWYGVYKGMDTEGEKMQTLCEHVSYFANALERDTISANIAKVFKKAKALVLAEVNGFKKGREDQVKELEEDETAWPKWIDVDKFLRYGFDCKVGSMEETGIYFNEKGTPKRLTNFVLTPLIHIYTKEEMGNRRLTELQNGYIKTVIELPSKAFTSMEAFDNIITSEGAFFTLDGFSKSHLNKLKAYYLGEYPKCFELNTLGWQPEGFFSFSNIIYKNHLVEYNNYGYAEVDGTNFLSMGASSALDGVRAEDDIYKNDKYLSYNKAEIDFKRWCELMVNVFPEHGMMGVAFAMMSVFKDILFKRNNNFPMLYAYGAVQAGKSKFAESVCNLFLHDKPMFNLNQGTDFGFFSELGMYRNVPVGLNEFDENAIKEEWFRALKGAFDGEGRKKGSGTRNKTKTQEIHAAVILIGQYLSTKDDNSVLSRTLPCKFTENNERSPQQIADYNELKLHEKKGISSLLCDIIQHRQHMADGFTVRFAKVSAELNAAFLKLGMQPKNRIIENYTTALTTISLMGEKLNLGFTYERFFKYSIDEIQKLAGIMSESNSLSSFWKTVEFLLDQNIIENGWHFKIKAESEVRISAGRDEHGKTTTKVLHFNEPKKLIYLRLSTIHALYMSEVKKQTGKVGQNEQTVLTYMKDQKYYVGSNPAALFTDGHGNSKNTSSYVFDYDMLGVHLETYKEEKVDPVATLDGQLWNDAIVAEVIGTPKLSFTLYKDESYRNETDQLIEKKIFTKCLSDDLSLVNVLKKMRQVNVTGNLNISKGGARNMAVTHIELTEIMTPNELPEGDAF